MLAGNSSWHAAVDSGRSHDVACCSGRPHAPHVSVRTQGNGAFTTSTPLQPGARDRTQLRTSTVVSALLPVPGLNPDKLSVTYMSTASATVKGSLRNLTSRRYTVTHNDVTGQLYLSVGEDFNDVQVGNWYTQLVRDEVRAEWCFQGGPALHLHCHVSGTQRWMVPASLRSYIFKREMPLVLDCIVYAERHLFRRAQLRSAPIFVHFESTEAGLARVEYWGTLGDWITRSSIPVTAYLAEVSRTLPGAEPAALDLPRAQIRLEQFMYALSESRDLDSPPGTPPDPSVLSEPTTVSADVASVSGTPDAVAGVTVVVTEEGKMVVSQTRAQSDRVLVDPTMEQPKAHGLERVQRPIDWLLERMADVVLEPPVVTDALTAVQSLPVTDGLESMDDIDLPDVSSLPSEKEASKVGGGSRQCDDGEGASKKSLASSSLTNGGDDVANRGGGEGESRAAGTREAKECTPGGGSSSRFMYSHGGVTGTQSDEWRASRRRGGVGGDSMIMTML